MVKSTGVGWGGWGDMCAVGRAARGEGIQGAGVLGVGSSPGRSPSRTLLITTPMSTRGHGELSDTTVYEP